jgi:hypothetical protein
MLETSFIGLIRRHWSSISTSLTSVLSNALRGLANAPASLLGIGFFVRAV